MAVEVAKKLGSKLDIVIPRKIPIPFDTEAGYGAVTEDGALVLNQDLVHQLKLTMPQIERQADEVKAEITRRTAVYRDKLKPSSVEGNVAIVIDDGLASGYTMMAAIKSIRKKRAAKVVVAVPVASSNAWELVKSAADELVCPVVAYTNQFAVAGFYRYWRDLTDEEVVVHLEEFVKYHKRRFNEKRSPVMGLS